MTDRAISLKEVIARIEQFASGDRVESNAGECVVVGKSDLDELFLILEAIIHLKYDCDTDGNSPVRITLSSKAKVYQPYIQPIPHTYDVNDLAEARKVMDICVANAISVNNDLRHAQDVLRYFEGMANDVS